MTVTQKQTLMHPALAYAKRIAYSSEQVLMFTYEMAVKYKDSPGVYVECGVAAGAQIIAMLAGLEGSPYPYKHVWAFDSFEGIPLPSNKDNQMPGIKILTKAEQTALPDSGKQALVSSGATIVSERDFMNHVRASGVNYESLIYIKGWFEETLPEIKKLDISVLRLDGDLYNSTYVCLKYLYPKVIKGGLVIIDDWALPGCRQAVYDYFTELKGVFEWPLSMEYITDKNSTVAYWVKK